MKSRTAILPIIALFLLAFFSPTASGKDTWISVKSENFYLIGNANEKDIRAVAIKLEQFRETFRLIFPSMELRQSIPTNVIVFKSAAAYTPFKPKRADGKADKWIAGYFQAGQDANYITLSTEGEMAGTYSTIFHEYTHFLVNTNLGKSDIPPWFNEGLAEYYETFSMDGDRKATLGYFNQRHLDLLRDTQLIPLKDFFEVDNYSLHQNGHGARSIFYAQAWALMHYMHQSGLGGSAQLNKFISLIMKKIEPEKAFRESFAMDYAVLEKILKKYVSQHTFKSWVATFEKPLVPDAQISSAPVSEAEANAYLGDLLYHTHEYENAEVYLKKALELDPNSSFANTSYGLVRMRQNKFGEAKQFLEKAIASGSPNYLAYYDYAFVLSREGMDQMNYVRAYSPETSDKIRNALKKAIEINPNFSESYGLLAFISIVNDERLDEALEYLKLGQQLQPGNQEYALRLAEIYERQRNFKDAKAIAEKLAKTADEPWIKSSAEGLLKSITSYEEGLSRYQKQKSDYEKLSAQEAAKGQPSKAMSPEDVKKIREEIEINSLNRSLPDLGAGERRVVGNIQKITCANGSVSYLVKAGNETLQLKSKDFDSIKLDSYTSSADGIAVGCDGGKLQNLLMVVTYRLAKNPAATSGDLIGLCFVPPTFKLRSEKEISDSEAMIEEMQKQAGAEIPRSIPSDGEMTEAKLAAIRRSLRQPNADEKHELAYLEKIECSGRSFIFVLATSAGTVRLKAADPENIKITAFTSEMRNFVMGCNAVLPHMTAVITYKQIADQNINGELIVLEFVPKWFKL